MSEETAPKIDRMMDALPYSILHCTAEKQMQYVQSFLVTAGQALVTSPSEPDKQRLQDVWKEHPSTHRIFIITGNACKQCHEIIPKIADRIDDLTSLSCHVTCIGATMTSRADYEAYAATLPFHMVHFDEHARMINIIKMMLRTRTDRISLPFIMSLHENGTVHSLDCRRDVDHFGVAAAPWATSARVLPLDDDASGNMFREGVYSCVLLTEHAPLSRATYTIMARVAQRAQALYIDLRVYIATKASTVALEARTAVCTDGIDTHPRLVVAKEGDWTRALVYEGAFEEDAIHAWLQLCEKTPEV
jgi:hypothetical protein